MYNSTYNLLTKSLAPSSRVWGFRGLGVWGFRGFRGFRGSRV